MATRPVTVYTSSDDGAPQLGTTGKPSAIIDILKKCLVEGYGTKQPLGWTIAFESVPTLKVAFRNTLQNGGSGGYTQFESSDGSDNNLVPIKLRSAQDMTGLDAFIRPTQSNILGPTSSNSKWWLVGTDRGFIISLQHTKANMDIGYAAEPGAFIGDIVSYLGNDAAPYVQLVNPTKYTDDSAKGYGSELPYLGSSDNQRCLKMYEADGGSLSDGLKLDFTWARGAKNSATPVVQTAISPIPIIMNSHGLKDRNGEYCANSDLMPYLRGVLPGIVQSVSFGYNDETFPVLKDFNGEQHRSLRTTVACQFWINEVTWYE